MYDAANRVASAFLLPAAASLDSAGVVNRFIFSCELRCSETAPREELHIRLEAVPCRSLHLHFNANRSSLIKILVGMSLPQLLNNPRLPYANKEIVRQKASALLNAVPSLSPKVGNLVLPDGRQYTLLILSGTIPIQYRGQQYNIPIEIFLPDAYPDQPPKAFVRPTASMIVKPGHRYVNSDGEIMIESLVPWTHDMYRRSSLVDVVQILMRAFSMDPPLFSVPANRSVTSATSAAQSTVFIPTSARNLPPPTGKFFGLLKLSLFIRIHS